MHRAQLTFLTRCESRSSLFQVIPGVRVSSDPSLCTLTITLLCSRWQNLLGKMPEDSLRERVAASAFQFLCMKKSKTPRKSRICLFMENSTPGCFWKPQTIVQSHTYSCQRNAQRPGSFITKITCFLKGGLNWQCENTSSASAFGASITFLKGRTRVMRVLEQN